MGVRKDITGQIFGHLKAINPTGEKIGGSYVWEFECLLCGKHISKRIGVVTSGEVVSCGCYKNRNLRTTPIQQKLGQVCETNLSRIKSKKVPSNNISGHKGVRLQTCKNKSPFWVAYIYFQNKRYHLGTFKNKEDAIEARERAEDALFGNFIEWYENEKKTNR